MTTLRLAKRHRRVRTGAEGIWYGPTARPSIADLLPSQAFVRFYEARRGSYPSSPRVVVVRWRSSQAPFIFGTEANAEAFVKARRCRHLFQEEPDYASLWCPHDRSYGGVFWKPDGGLALVHPGGVVETRGPRDDLEELLCTVPEPYFDEAVAALTKESP